MSPVDSKRKIYIVWGLSGEFVVYTFILMLTKNQKNQTTGIRDFLA